MKGGITMSKIAILADSGCQIKKDAFLNEGVYIVPLQITVNNQSYLDGIDIDSKAVFERIQDEKCIATTSQPSTGSLIEVIDQIKEDGYDEIIGISLASGLSSTIQGMKIAADMQDMPITMVDSKGTAGNHKYLIKVAMTLIKEGKSSVEIKEVLEGLVKDSATLILVSDLGHLKRGGRITPAVALLGGMLKIVPVMKLNENLGGKIDAFDKVRTIKKANHCIVEYFKERNINSNDYIITIEDVLVPELREEMSEYTKMMLDSDTIYTGLLPAVVGVHMGIGGIGYQYIRKYQGIEQIKDA